MSGIPGQAGPCCAFAVYSQGPDKGPDKGPAVHVRNGHVGTGSNYV